MVSIKQEVTGWDDTKMISIKQELPNWDDPNNIDIDWDQDFRFQFMDLPTSEFLTSAAEFEQTYGGSSFSATGWEQLVSPKSQVIRNHDCMWSGTCFDQSHPGKVGCGANHGPTNTSNTEDPTVAINKFNTVTAVAAASLNNNVAATQKPILTPSNTSALNINNNMTPKINTLKTAQIPAGRSLLINPRMKQQQQTNNLPTVTTSDFLRDRETTVPLHTRPDTPLSLDEDPPEFKHNIDLATCTIGSNRLSLTSSSRHYNHHQNHHDDPSSHRIINMLKEQLEDTESGSLRMTSSSGEIGSLTDLLNDLEEIEGDDGDDSHGDDMDSDTDSNADNGSSRGSSKGGGIPGGYTHAHHQEMSPSSSSSSASSSPPASYEYQGTHVGDHSYTRPKDRYHLTGLGVQTPSDSEEEIDVVSIGEKNLPTNPTPRDRRALQNRVAHKIARKQSQTVPPAHHHRRRHSDDGYASHHGTPSGAAHSSPGKSYGYSPNYLTPASSTTISGTNTPLPGSSSSGSSSNSRKRPNKDDRNGKNRHHQHRSKKQRIPGGKSIARSVESSEELETLEKRNLHNDMERQRRIGLKNLFEELKRQIPNLRDKERAPKVNILREAATLCTRLNREQEQLNALRKQQQRLYARVRQLRTSLHSHRRVMD